MINIKETVKTPSAALQFMVDGLRKQAKRKDFKINMGSFGDFHGSTCFGCAATCNIQEIAGKNLTAKKILLASERAEALGFNLGELIHFEPIINGARMGELRRLFDFFHFLPLWKKEYNDRFFLRTDNWESELPKVELLIKELKEKGL